MARTWLSIRVELVSGRGEDLWPRPGRGGCAVVLRPERDAYAIVDADADVRAGQLAGEHRTHRHGRGERVLLWA